MSNQVAARIRVLLVDDNLLVLEAVRSYLSRHGRFEVVGEAVNGTEAVRKTRELLPDVVVMDITMPGMNGLEATRCLRETCPQSRVLILTVHEKREFIAEMMRSGARGCMRKSSTPVELVAAIESIHSGALAFGPDLALAVVEEPPAWVASQPGREPLYPS